MVEETLLEPKGGLQINMEFASIIFLTCSLVIPFLLDILALRLRSFQHCWFFCCILLFLAMLYLHTLEQILTMLKLISRVSYSIAKYDINISNVSKVLYPHSNVFLKNCNKCGWFKIGGYDHIRNIWVLKTPVSFPDNMFNFCYLFSTT